MDTHMMQMGEPHGIPQLLLIEIARARPRRIRGIPQIHRVRAAQHRHLQLFPVPCRSQQLRFFSLRRHPNFRRLALCSDRVRLNTCRWVSGLST